MSWIALFLLLGSAGTRPATYCLPQAQAVLGGIRLDLPGDSVVVRLGQPTQEYGKSETGDGGDLTIRELIYPHFQVDVRRGQTGRVERLVTTSSRITTPAGIRIGQTLEEVAQRLGISSWMDEFEEVTWTPPLCDDGPLNGSAEVTFTWVPVPGPFDPRRPLEQERKLMKLEMTHHGP